MCPCVTECFVFVSCFESDTADACRSTRKGRGGVKRLAWLVLECAWRVKNPLILLVFFRDFAIPTDVPLPPLLAQEFQ